MSKLDESFLARLQLLRDRLVERLGKKPQKNPQTSSSTSNEEPKTSTVTAEGTTEETTEASTEESSEASPEASTDAKTAVEPKAPTVNNKKQTNGPDIPEEGTSISKIEVLKRPRKALPRKAENFEEDTDKVGSRKQKIFEDYKVPNAKKQKLFACVFCKGNHFNDKCRVYPTVKERQKIIKSEHRCFLCFRPGHAIKACRKKPCCFFCEGAHNRSLCPSVYKL